MTGDPSLNSEIIKENNLYKSSWPEQEYQNILKRRKEKCNKTNRRCKSKKSKRQDFLEEQESDNSSDVGQE